MAQQQSEDQRITSLPSPPRHVTEAGLAELLDLSPDALLVVNKVGTIIKANEQASALFGYALQDLLGTSLERLLPDHLHAIHVAHREHYFAIPRTRSMGSGLDLLGRYQDGNLFPVDISLRPILLDGELLVIGAVRDKSDQQRAEYERRQQEETLRQQARMIDLSHDAIFIRDQHAHVTFWNKGAEELYGWSAQEVLGHISHIVLKTRFPISISTIEEQVEYQGGWEGELTHTCKDGRSILVESRWSPVYDTQGHFIALLEINRDISERRRLEQVAQAIHAQTLTRLSLLQQLIDAVPSSIYLVYGPDARLLLANRAAAELWGVQWPIDQPMEVFLMTNGISITNAQGRPLALSELATLKAVCEGKTIRQHQETVWRPNHSNLPVLVNAVALDSPQMWQVIRPNTDAAQMGQSLPITSVALVVHQDVSALKEAEYLKDEFIALATHELRNPLAALKGFADLLLYQTAQGRGPQLASWQQEALQEIEQATGRLEKLTEDLLDITRLQAGRLTLRRTPTDLVSIINHMIVQAQITSAQHTFTFRSSSPSLLAEVDRVRIEQVLSNLLGNAMKYSPKGGPIDVYLREEQEPHVALLSIRDKGIGIPADQQASLFGRFVRAENARALSIMGTGLGLSLSRELITLHGGSLWFESVENVGSTFFLTLPLS